MTGFRTALTKFIWLFKRREKENELRDELAFHLDEEAGERGDDAARRDFGNLTLIREETRAAWSWNWIEQFFQDVRYAARTMLSNKAFTALAVLSLALGIGANTAIYSFADALLFRLLPVKDPKSLVVLEWRSRGDNEVMHLVSGSISDVPGGSESSIFPYRAFETLRDSTRSLDSLFAYRRSERLTLLARGEAEVARGEYVSGNFFDGLGVNPAAGRLITNPDDRAGALPVLVLSYATAQARFGDAASAAGQPVFLNNIPFTVIGVAPESFTGVDPGKTPDFYLPLHADLLVAPRNPGKPSRYADDNYYWIEMMGRLAPGVKREQADAELSQRFAPWVLATAATDIEKQHLPTLFVSEGGAGLDHLRREFASPLTLLLAITGAILAIACANIASLLLARAAARKREMAVRLSIGAGRGRVIRQLLTESVGLASLGGSLGVLLAIWGIQLLLAMFGGQIATLKADLNWHVLLAASGLTILTGVLFGLAPAWQSAKVDVIPALKETRGSAKARRSRFGLSQALMISQIALSMLLLIVAGLFVRTISNLNSLDMGFRRESLLVFKLNARQAGHRDPEIVQFYSNIRRRFAEVAGVRKVAMANEALIGAGAYGWPVLPVGKPYSDHMPTGHGSGTDAAATHTLAIAPGFFATLDIPLVAGREFDERDQAGSLPVVIVNEAWTRINFENRNPVGERVISYGMDGKAQPMEVVGLVKNSRYDNIGGNFPAIAYMPFTQNLTIPLADMEFYVRTAGEPLSAAHTIREIVQQADPRIPVANLTTQSAQITEQMSDQIVLARLCSGFALLALLIACVGLYGTMSYSVARRTGEIGIRMALGAPRIQVVWMVMQQVIVLASIGLIIGAPGAMASSQILKSLLYGIGRNDVALVGAGVVVMFGVLLAAGYAPARRASRIDPMIALRNE